MAVRRKLCGTWKGPSIFDDAIDWEQTPLIQYRETRDPALVRCRPGEQATLWTLRDLPQSKVAFLGTLESPLREYTAFSAACCECSDPAIAFDGSGEERVIRQDSIDRFVPEQVWRELGTLALQRARLTEGEAPRFALPPGLPAIRRQPRDTTVNDADGK